MKIGYVNVFVRDFETSRRFFTDILGLELNSADDGFGYASFNAGPVSFAIAQTDDADLVGRHTGIGFMCDDIHATFEALTAKGVEFAMAPTDQPWGGVLAIFKDPDGNAYYLDPGMPH